MNCEEAINLRDGYLDGELDPITNQAIEQHLQICPACDQAYQLHGSFIRAVSGATPYETAPVGLRESVRSSLRAIPAQASEDARPAVPIRRAEDFFRSTPWNWLAMAAAILFAAIVAFKLVPGSRADDHFLATELIASHARSLLANHLTDVPSSDQHTVKPWMDAKLDFAPRVADLANDGFPLVGGRLDYLEHRPVAALVYQRRKHFINLFVWPVEANAARSTQPISRQGYQLLHWVDADFNYWAVSDVNAGDLQIFREKFEAQTSRR